MKRDPVRRAQAKPKEALLRKRAPEARESVIVTPTEDGMAEPLLAFQDLELNVSDILV